VTWQPAGADGPVDDPELAQASVWFGKAPVNTKPAGQPGAERVIGVETVIDAVCAYAGMATTTIQMTVDATNTADILRIKALVISGSFGFGQT
jgi:hypothetical protein